MQALDGLVGYSDGYLVQYPFKFPVDKETFQTVQRKWMSEYWLQADIADLSEIAGEWRRVRFHNNGRIYDKYLGDDKDWIYYRTDTTTVNINRTEKKSDFAFVSDELQEDLATLVKKFCEK